ncbi:MAG: cytochrome b [Alphaproteobacteria bacterium]|nr:cytochrome b [Alphaproteobacteria bacterium]
MKGRLRPPARAASDAELAGGYDPVARATHWIVAILAVVVVSLGWAIPDAPRNTGSRELLLTLHRSLGLTILGLMLFRGVWRWRHPVPPLTALLPRREIVVAQASHIVLYALFILMPVAGYLNAAAAGHTVSLFGLLLIPPLVPEDDRLSQIAIAVHLVGQYLVYAFVALHIAAAMMHAVVRRNGVLERMLPRPFRARP